MIMQDGSNQWKLQGNQMLTSFGPSLNTRVSQANMLGIHLTTFSQRSSYVTLLPQPPSYWHIIQLAIPLIQQNVQCWVDSYYRLLY